MITAQEFLSQLSKGIGHPANNRLKLNVELLKAVEGGKVPKEVDIKEEVNRFIDDYPTDLNEIMDRVMDYVRQDELIGICLACGEEYDSPLEPDAREVECQACGEPRVYGAQEILIMYAPL